MDVAKRRGEGKLMGYDAPPSSTASVLDADVMAARSTGAGSSFSTVLNCDGSGGKPTGSSSPSDACNRKVTTLTDDGTTGINVRGDVVKASAE